ncbi:MAG: ribosome silencing factor [Alphaproteobacteria bacterium]
MKPISAEQHNTADMTTDQRIEHVRSTVMAQLEDDKAEDLVSIDLSGKSSIADFMIIASGSSSRKVSAMADHLTESLKAAGVTPVRMEGKANADWVLIDAGDVIIHLFRPEVREFYRLEDMWGLPGQEAREAS